MDDTPVKVQFTIEEKALSFSAALSLLSSKYADEYRPESTSGSRAIGKLHTRDLEEPRKRIENIQ